MKQTQNQEVDAVKEEEANEAKLVQQKHDVLFGASRGKGKRASQAKSAKRGDVKGKKTKSTPKVKKAKRLTEDELKNKYKHFVVGSLKFDEKESKNQCTIRCTEKGCKKTRKVWTSDLFQVKRCEECTKEHRNDQRKKK